MIAVDTSVVVAALCAWHADHASACAAIVGGVRLPAHCLIESYSVLTRLPPPHRLDADDARDLLRSSFPDDPITLDGGSHAALVVRMSDAGVAGGAAYDALIGFTAAEHDALLRSRDQRAARVYAALGVRFELLD